VVSPIEVQAGRMQLSMFPRPVRKPGTAPSLARQCAFSRVVFPLYVGTLLLRQEQNPLGLGGSDTRDSRDFIRTYGVSRGAHGAQPSATYYPLSGPSHAADERGRWLGF